MIGMSHKGFVCSLHRHCPHPILKFLFQWTVGVRDCLLTRKENIGILGNTWEPASGTCQGMNEIQ